jgi:imidazolonepropionase-like amidohydrolase
MTPCWYRPDTLDKALQTIEFSAPYVDERFQGSGVHGFSIQRLGSQHMAKHIYAIVALGVTLVGAGVAGKQQQPGQDTQSKAATFLIRDVRLFDGERVVDRTSVLVRDGLIVSVGGDAPPGIETISGEGRTLTPGLIDAHAHAFGDALERALVFGVTTELDMFTDHRFAATMRAEQQRPEGAVRRADLFSAGTLVTSPKGHGTEYGMAIPTLASAGEAPAFVDARIAEGSDYIKIIYDDGASYGLSFPTISREVLQAAIAATKARGKLAVVHIGSRQGAQDAIAAGASGLVHIFADTPADAGWVQAVVAAKAFVTPTLSVTESTTGVGSGASLVKDSRLAPFINSRERASLATSFPRRTTSRQDLSIALAATKMLHDAGVPILAGTDAPNPGTAHGSSLHRELELLVRAGLSNEAALAAASSVPARSFGLRDRGRVAPGLRADLLLVAGDPTRDITATRDIVAIWKRGVRVDRPKAPPETAAPDAPTKTGVVSDFESGAPRAEFGSGWQISTDGMMGGKSTAEMTVISGGANGSRSALEVNGTINAGAPFPWAGAMFFPAATPMTPVNLSRFKELVFWARGDGGEHQVMVFASRLGNIPAVRPFKPAAEWQEFVMPLTSFSGIDGSDLRGVLLSAGAKPGPFRFAIDDVRFR